jgi:predicted peptidase
VAGLQKRFAIDPKRVYVTGLSSGGSACWRWAIDYPNDLAAIAPMCGGCDSSKMGSIVNVPVRAYHGDADPFVPIALQQACVNELQRQGGTASLTVYKGVGHDSWVRGYEDPDLVPWLLSHTRA